MRRDEDDEEDGEVEVPDDFLAGGEAAVAEVGAGDEGVEKARGADVAEVGRDAGDALELFVDIDFVPGDQAAEPFANLASYTSAPC